MFKQVCGSVNDYEDTLVYTQDIFSGGGGGGGVGGGGELIHGTLWYITLCTHHPIRNSTCIQDTNDMEEGYEHRAGGGL